VGGSACANLKKIERKSSQEGGFKKGNEARDPGVVCGLTYQKMAGKEAHNPSEEPAEAYELLQQSHHEARQKTKSERRKGAKLSTRG